MKYIGVIKGNEACVAVLRGGRLIPLAGLKEFWSDPELWQTRAQALQTSAEDSIDRSSVTEIPIVPPTARIICVGLNYRAHAAEGSFEVPMYPTLFGRWTASLSVGGQSAPVPHGEAGLDWEGEVAAYIGRQVHRADESTADAAIFGYSTFNDLTARRAQKLTAQWTLGKNGDFSGPMGPLVSRDEVGDLRDGLQLRTRVNRALVQDGNTRDMIFSVGEIIALVSQTMTLNPGDVIATGTPEGVGYVRNPPWLLQPGDTVEVEIDKLGKLVTPISAYSYQPDA